MRYHIGGIELPREIIDELAEIYPEGRVDDWRFRAVLDHVDPRCQKVLNWLEQHGFKPWDGISARDDLSHYDFGISRAYDLDDYRDCLFVRLAPTSAGNGLFRDQAQRIEMIEHRFPRQADFIHTPLSWVVVPERVKRAIESESFNGVAFKETVLVGGHPTLSKMEPRPWSRYGEPWWELSSEIVLPPLSPNMEVFDEQGNRAGGGDCSHGCYPREGFYLQPEYRFRATDLSKIGPFDLARTTEAFGAAGHVDTWHYIASARFRVFCVAHKWKCDWIPVRIDPD